jgi:hypothetical protein
MVWEILKHKLSLNCRRNWIFAAVIGLIQRWVSG